MQLLMIAILPQPCRQPRPKIAEAAGYIATAV
jgi:hypothetical protein